MIVITLTKVPPSLRGDLTKWYQEVQTGIYVGNVSARIRDKLWERIIRDIGNGYATMVYNTKNEFGYDFKTTRPDRKVVNFDGIPLMMRVNSLGDVPVKYGFSTAAKIRRAKSWSKKKNTGNKEKGKIACASIDVETTGLDEVNDHIISIGSWKTIDGSNYKSFYKLVKTDHKISKEITRLTSISNQSLDERGINILDALKLLKEFIMDLPLVGYNLRFDDLFISQALRNNKLPLFSNKLIDLLPIVKKNNRFIDNYRLETVLRKYDITNENSHNSLSDAQATMKLAIKLMKNDQLEL